MSVSIPRLDLAQEAAANAPSDYIARFFFPTSDVMGTEAVSGTNLLKAKVMKIDRANVLGPRSRSLKRQFGETPARRSGTMSETTITIEERAEEFVMSDVEFETYRKRLRSVEDRLIGPALASDFRIDEEKDFVTMFTGGSFTQGSANGTAANRWDSDGSNPISALDGGFDNIKVESGLSANRLGLTKNYADALKHNAHMRSLLRLDERGSLTGVQMGELIRDALWQLSPTVMNQAGGDFQVRVQLGVYDSAVEGATASNSYIWSTGALLTAAPPTDARGVTTVEDLGGGKTYQAMAYRVKRYEENGTDLVVYQARSFDTAAIVDVNAFYYFTGYTTSG